MKHNITGDFHKLTEKALRRDGTAPVKLIAPGWGSSGYYPAEVLERDGPTLFRAGTKMYWDHPTVTEEMERPEGSLRNLAAVLVSDARWDGQGPEGPGLYADAKVFEGYQQAVNEMAPHIGVSIRASGRAAQGEAEGRRGPIIQALTAAASVDFVTEPGAGGKIVQMFEAARSQSVREARNVGEWLESRLHLMFTEIADHHFGEGKLSRDERIALSSAIGAALDAFRATVASEAAQLYNRDVWQDADGVIEATETSTDNEPLPAEESARESNQTQEETMELEELKAQLAEANGKIEALTADNARLAETLLLRDAQAIAAAVLAEADLPDVTRQRMQRTVAVNPPVVDGKLDEAALRTRVQEAVTAETAYLSEAAGWNGRIKGMGGGQAAPAMDNEQLTQRMTESFRRLGLSEDEVTTAVNGRIV